MLFLIQEEPFDFCYEARNACMFKNWITKEHMCEWEDVPTGFEETIFTKYQNTVRNVVPIGSIEFVQTFYQIAHHFNLRKGGGIPKDLFKMEYLDRSFYQPVQKEDKWALEPILLRDKNESDPVSTDTKMFCKSENIKEYVNLAPVSTLFAELSRQYTNPLNCLFSTEENFISEYRCFVYDGQFLDCRCYAGDFKQQPDYPLIEQMIKDYSSNRAYTLDIAINERGNTVIVEVHDFYSCGLYGFADYERLIRMFILTHQKIMQEQEDLKNGV